MPEAPKPARKPRYYLATWDTDRQEFTPLRTPRCGPYSLWGLRKAVRKLRALGYPCNYSRGYGDPSVLAYRVDP